MRKTIITILSFLYLMSSIGFGSTQYFCQSMQQMMPADERQCCSAESATGSPRAPQAPQEMDDHSCCAVNTAHPPVRTHMEIVPDECCEAQHVYNELDSPPVPLSKDVSQFGKSSGESTIFPEHTETVDRSARSVHTDPSFFLNLPLLI